MKDYEQIIATLLAKIADLETVVIQQAARIAELEKRLDKNSSNSSKPPSSYGLAKPPRTSSLRENGKHKSGGQPGHKGETLKQTETPDIVKKYALTTCPYCNEVLTRLSHLNSVQSLLPRGRRWRAATDEGVFRWHGLERIECSLCLLD